MFPVIEAYLESGLTQTAFCTERGLSAPGNNTEYCLLEGSVTLGVFDKDGALH